MPFGSHERRNLLNNIGRFKKRLEERKDEEVIETVKQTTKRQRATTRDLDEIVKKEVWLNTTHDQKPENISKYKHKELLKEEYWTCMHCGGLTKDKYYIDIFNLNKGFICKKCNEQFYNNKAVKILY
jgi:hypothetical protein